MVPLIYQAYFIEIIAVNHWNKLDIICVPQSSKTIQKASSGNSLLAFWIIYLLEGAIPPQNKGDYH